MYDDVEYLSSLGKAQTANVKRDAAVGVAQANRDAGIRVFLLLLLLSFLILLTCHDDWTASLRGVAFASVPHLFFAEFYLFIFSGSGMREGFDGCQVQHGHESGGQHPPLQTAEIQFRPRD